MQPSSIGSKKICAHAGSDGYNCKFDRLRSSYDRVLGFNAMGLANRTRDCFCGGNDVWAKFDVSTLMQALIMLRVKQVSFLPGR